MADQNKVIFVNATGEYEETAAADSIGPYASFKTTTYELTDALLGKLVNAITSSAGAGDADKFIKTNGSGLVDSSFIDFQAFNKVFPARVKTTAALPSTAAVIYNNGTSGVGATLTRGENGALGTIDGVTLIAGDRILVNDQAAGLQNGIYEVTALGDGSNPWVLTRTTDYDESAEIQAGDLVVIEEGTSHADTAWILTTDNAITVGTTAISYSNLGTTTIVDGNGLSFSGNTLNVNLLASGGLKFTGDDIGVEPNDFAGAGLVDDGSDNLAIDWSTLFNDAKAVKAEDLNSTTNGEGASIIGIEDPSAYYTGTNVEAALDELEAQLGGDTSSTYNFTEDNVLADNDAVYAALNKLDLKWGDLASTANGEGASLVGVEDSAGNFTGTDVEAVLAELYTLASEVVCESYTVGTGGVTKGDLLSITSNDTVQPLTIANNEYGIGLAKTTEIATASVKVAENGAVVTGILTAATAGTKYYWDGSTHVTSIPAGSGNRVFQTGIAKNATDLAVEVEFVKRNA
jgi:hypothetical protein